MFTRNILHLYALKLIKIKIMTKTTRYWQKLLIPRQRVSYYRIIPLVPAGISRDSRVFLRSGNYTGRELNEKFLKNRI